MVLSVLGALLDADSEWDERLKGVSVAQWRHLAAILAGIAPERTWPRGYAERAARGADPHRQQIGGAGTNGDVRRMRWWPSSSDSGRPSSSAVASTA
jgi:hypothetical protein